MDEDLALVERAQIARLWIAELDDAKQFVVDWIGDRNRVRKLLRGIEAILVADRNVRVGGEAGRLGPMMVQYIK